MRRLIESPRRLQHLLFATLLAVFMSSGRVAHGETIEDTDWGQRTGFAQNRLFAGLAVKLGEAKAEVGYLNQFLDGSGTDKMNHILSINLFLNF